MLEPLLYFLYQRPLMVAASGHFVKRNVNSSYRAACGYTDSRRFTSIDFGFNGYIFLVFALLKIKFDLVFSCKHNLQLLIHEQFVLYISLHVIYTFYSN